VSGSGARRESKQSLVSAVPTPGSTDEASGTTREISASASELMRTGQQLEQLVARFRRSS